MSFPDRQTVLDFLKENPAATSKADIARGLKVKGRERAILREVLEELEREGKLSTGIHWPFFRNADATDPAVAGIWGAL